MTTDDCEIPWTNPREASLLYAGSKDKEVGCEVSRTNPREALSHDSSTLLAPNLSKLITRQFGQVNKSPCPADHTE
jgi:hypothetical protein